MNLSKNHKFFVCAAGIFVSYFYFGILQEKITRSKYIYEIKNDDGSSNSITEHYKYFLVLVFVQCLVSCLFAKALLTTWPHGEDNTRSVYYASTALTYLLAMVCSNMALQWVSYPTQVVGKSAKPIPVLILGVLLGRKRYPARKYLFVILIVAGVILFMFKDNAKGGSKTESLIGIGEILLLLSLLMDGLTGAVQERMRAESQPTGQQMMLNINVWSCIFLGLAITITGEGVAFCDFVSRHPMVLMNLTLLSAASAIGQLFIYVTVSEFGPLLVSLITTTRKFFTVLVSVLFFGNSLSLKQWIGASIVFIGIFLDGYFSKSPPKKK